MSQISRSVSPPHTHHARPHPQLGFNLQRHQEEDLTGFRDWRAYQNSTTQGNCAGEVVFITRWGEVFSHLFPSFYSVLSVWKGGGVKRGGGVLPKALTPLDAGAHTRRWREKMDSAGTQFFGRRGRSLKFQTFAFIPSILFYSAEQNKWTNEERTKRPVLLCQIFGDVTQQKLPEYQKCLPSSVQEISISHTWRCLQKWLSLTRGLQNSHAEFAG